jgi:hypothetical protein
VLGGGLRGFRPLACDRSVVVEDVELSNGLCRGLHRGVVGDVELYETGVQRVRRSFAAVAIARTDPDLMAGRLQLSCSFEAESLVRAGDEGNGDS